ncbi:hypothetical protein JX265_011482 [Neoarthrinium moseri]|uniref:Uncharacterized protein n=1 Tax=Neoarthrinium moseri TaxID=1658444 RepID=A0A9P9WCS1_9PEZI|nr:hypothetical protein JX265_011482 [Neoarthrinium moseri]
MVFLVFGRRRWSTAVPRRAYGAYGVRSPSTFLESAQLAWDGDHGGPMGPRLGLSFPRDPRGPRGPRGTMTKTIVPSANLPVCPNPPALAPPSDRRPPSDAESQSRLIKPAPGLKRTRPLMLNPSSKMQPSMPSSVLMLLGCIAIDSEAPLPVCAGYGETVPQEREGFSGPARKDQLQTPHLAESLIRH